MIRWRMVIDGRESLLASPLIGGTFTLRLRIRAVFNSLMGYGQRIGHDQLERSREHGWPLVVSRSKQRIE